MRVNMGIELFDQRIVVSTLIQSKHDISSHERSGNHFLISLELCLFPFLFNTKGIIMISRNGSPAYFLYSLIASPPAAVSSLTINAPLHSGFIAFPILVFIETIFIETSSFYILILKYSINYYSLYLYG
jgi:hypothetical protein